VALARGETERARPSACAAVGRFENAGYWLEASTTRRALADALRASGDVAAAKAELRRLVEDGGAMGAALAWRRQPHVEGWCPGCGRDVARDRSYAVISVHTVEGQVDNIGHMLPGAHRSRGRRGGLLSDLPRRVRKYRGSELPPDFA